MINNDLYYCSNYRLAGELLLHKTNDTMCIICGNPVTKEGYRVSWDIEDLDLGEEGDERYFCSFNCVEKWVNNLGTLGHEEILDVFELNQITEQQ